MNISKELWLRIQSATVLAALTLFALLYHPSSFTMLLLIGGVIALKEWRGLNYRRRWSFALLTAVYTFSALASLWWLRHTELALPDGMAQSAMYVLALFITVWSADIAGYAFGKLIGGPKCWPTISPGKTWSGTAAALVLGSVACVIVLREFTGITHQLYATGLGVATTIAAIAGDALESYLKRKAGVKDSGKLLPGHGGLLDRIDALMAAAPVFAGGVYAYYWLWA